MTFEPIKIWNRQAPQNDHLNLSFLKDNHIIGKTITTNGRKMAIYLFRFISNQSILGFSTYNWV